MLNIEFQKAHSGLSAKEQENYAMCLAHPFRERVTKSWQLFAEKEKYEMILSPEGNLLSFFVLDYYRKRAADSIKEKWNILVGRQPNANIGIRMGDANVDADDFQMWVKNENGMVELELYCEKLLALLRENEGEAYNIMYVLLDNTVGELAGMKYIGYVELLPKKKQEAGESLSELPAVLERICGSRVCMPEIFYDSYSGYRPNQVDDKHDRADRGDVFVGTTRCYPCVYDYMERKTAWVSHLASSGICLGYFAYPNDMFAEVENRGEAILDFRDGIQAKIAERAGEDCVLFTGGASGVFSTYIDFIAWDIKALLEAAEAVFGESPLSAAFYRSMRQDAEVVRLK